MYKLKKMLGLFLIAATAVTLTNCGTNQEKKDGNAEAINQEAAALLKEQNELYELACRELSDINQKVVELNRKIRSMTGKLTEAQNNAIDEIEEKRTSINTRMKGVKTVSKNDWESFKTTLMQDINDTKIKIDELLNGIK